jgi:hypothetical protein
MNMKTILLSLGAALFLWGCSAGSQKTVDMSAINNGISEMKDIPAMTSLTEDSISDYLNLSKDDYIAAVCYMPLMSVTATEVMLFQYDSDTQKEKIQTALESRLKELENTWSQYLPEQYKLVKDCASYDENYIAGYVIGEDSFLTAVKQLIADSTE